MKNKIGVVGATGNLGKAVLEELKTDERFELEGTYARSLVNDLERSDAHIWLEVSLSESLDRTLFLAVQKKIPLVIGSTGLTFHQKQTLETASETLPIFYSPNFSIGMTLLFQLSQIIAKTNPESSIVETHRAHKKDSPSGSAVLLASQIESAGGSPPSIHSIRACDVFGEHELRFDWEGETLTCSHSVRNRRAFAKGALNACAFLLSQPPGLYSMQNILYTSIHAENSCRKS